MNSTHWPDSLLEINSLSAEEKETIYRTLLPTWLFTRFGVNSETLSVNGQRVVHFHAPDGSRVIEISAYRFFDDRDPVFYLNMTDTQNNQLLVLLIVINNPESPRYNIDVDENGESTQLGTISRNLIAERAAMEAGLVPGQIRSGLRGFQQGIPLFEQFIKRMGHDMFLIEPLAYHNAIIFEKYGFNYIRGQREMMRIHEEFQPGGELHKQLTIDNPFRMPDAWKTIRGRSWAIHDGILGKPFTGFQMYKIVGRNADVRTFPDAQW